jgi:uncharacterized protein (TIGR02996 family)
VETAFLKHITDEPDDVVSRLVFADWLCEQDDLAPRERGEFIRVQHALAGKKVPPEDRTKLIARQKALLEHYREGWEEPFRGLVGHCAYRGGFAERVSLSVEQFVDHFAKLVELTPVVRVHLSGLNADTVGVVAATESLARVRELDLSGTRATADTLREFLASPHLGRLRALNLSRTSTGDEGVRALVASPVFRRLRYLNLSNAGVSTPGVHTLVNAIYNRTPALEYLVLRGAPRIPPGTFPPVPPGLPLRLRQSLQAQLGLELGVTQNLLEQLFATRETLSPGLQQWVDWLHARKPGDFRRAVKELPLPEPLRRVFTMVCQRRVVWRANRLRLTPPEDSNSEDLSRLLKLLFEMSLIDNTETMGDLRREMAFPITCLLDLYLRHDRGDLPADGRTR